MCSRQLFSSPLLQSLVSLLFFLFNSYAQDAELIRDCYALAYNCGTLRGIRYPFYGDSRPSFCGLAGFQLTCNNEEYSTIDINNQMFRVLSINQSTSSMTIAKDDIWDDACLEIFINNTIPNELLYVYGPETRNISLFYDCPIGVDVSSRNTVTCQRNDTQSNIGFLADESIPSPPCGINITVPVRRSVLEEFRNNSSMIVRDLLNQGFDVVYNMDNITCLTCQLDGRCWNISSCARTPSSGRNSKVRLAIGVSLSGMVILFGTIIFCYCRFKITSHKSVLFWTKKTKCDQNLEDFFRHVALKRYSYSDIKKMTNSFKEKLGQGGYGVVYKGSLLNGHIVAAKVLNESKGNGEDFINEVASISRTSHVNVVTLIGFCLEGRKRALIYDFMPNGSLEKFIYGKNPTKTGEQLGWENLYQIAIGIARGLEYLHRGCNTRILHLDIKPHNILLDGDFCPKISDFGLSKLCSRKESIVSMFEARGTIGYIAPEVFSRNYGGVSNKSDVYSYGMMILEMVGGRKNVDVGVSHTSKVYFPHWAYKRLELDEDLELQDVVAHEESEIARKMILVGFWCIQADPSQRPSMNKVIDMLEGSVESLKIPPKPFLYSPSRSASNSFTTAADH